MADSAPLFWSAVTGHRFGRLRPVAAFVHLNYTRVNHMKHSEGFLKLVNDAKTRIREVTVDETRQRMAANNAVRLIDVREDHEWEGGRAAGSIHLAKGIIERDIEATVPDKSTEVILYCGGGFRSALAADVLQQMGYTNVFSMAGGWKAWQDSGAPVEEG